MRFNPSKYDPTADSSKITPAKAKRIDGDPATLLVLDQSPGKAGAKTCESGSRKEIGAKSRFAPGGDASLKGKLIRAHLTGTKVAVLPFEGDADAKVKPVTALALAQKSYPIFAGWLSKASDRAASAASEAEARKAAAATRREKAAEVKAAKAAEAKVAKAEKAEQAAASQADTTPGDQPDLNGATVTFKIGKNDIEGQVVKVENGTATVEYAAKSGAKSVRKVKVTSLTVTD